MRELLKMSSSESVLSCDYQKVADVLRDRMKNAVIVNPNNTKGSVVATLAKNLYRRNFSINEVGVVIGTVKSDMDQKHFHVSFLENNGVIGDTMWVTGSVFRDLISHKNKKPKYVFDDTVIQRDEWVSMDCFYENDMS